MKIKEHYPLGSNSIKTEFYFESIGAKGRIKKWVWFQYMSEDRYNLAFGDLVDGEHRDEVVSNNLDFVKVLSTVGAAAYEFLERYPNVVIEIEAVDNKRLRLYNLLFQRKHQEIIDLFDLTGFSEEGIPEEYDPNKSYWKFELQKKFAYL